MSPGLIRLCINHLECRRHHLAALMAVVVALQVAAAAGLALVAGWHLVWRTWQHFRWPYLIAVAGGLAVSFVGYYLGYRGIYRAEDGPRLTRRQMRAVVTASFGGFLGQGGATLDRFALQAGGAGLRDAKVRSATLGAMEQGMLSLLGTAAAVTVLVLGLPVEGDVTWPWAVLPLPGFALAFWLAPRWRGRWNGWRGRLVDTVLMVRCIFRRPVRNAGALAGMAVFWVGETFAAWAGLAAFGWGLNAGQLAVGFATGMLFTRRTGPLAGAGLMELILPLGLWTAGVPLAPAVLGVLAYRLLSLWLPMPGALAQLPELRAMLPPGPSRRQPALPG
jgi:hypothetical protein